MSVFALVLPAENHPFPPTPKPIWDTDSQIQGSLLWPISTIFKGRGFRHQKDRRPNPSTPLNYALLRKPRPATPSTTLANETSGLHAAITNNPSRRPITAELITCFTA